MGWCHAGDASRLVRIQAARAVGVIIRIQRAGAYSSDNTRRAMHLTAACSFAEQCSAQNAWHPTWMLIPAPDSEAQAPEMQIDAVMTLEHVQALTTALLINEQDPDVQVVKICLRM